MNSTLTKIIRKVFGYKHTNTVVVSDRRSMEPLKSDATTIFIITDRPWYTNWCVYRVMWKGKRPRVIAFSYLSMESYLPKLDAIEDDTLLHVVHRLPATRPDIYVEGEVIMILQGCKLKNKWIPDLVSHSRQEVVCVFVELECEDIIERFNEPNPS